MKILVVADIEDRLLYDFFRKDRVEGVELIVSCGDLKPDYLDFLMTMVGAPMIYIMGNHDDDLIAKPPLGGICIEDKIYKYKGYNFAGLGGCLRYNNRVKNMYSPFDMNLRASRLAMKSVMRGGIDILVTHAPAKGYGDLEDLPHRGFEAFNKLMNVTKPKYMVHGHVHKNYAMNVKTETVHESGTIIVNAYGYQIIDLPDK